MKYITISGTIHKQTGRGKKLGYPTANIPLTHHIPEGVYLGYATHKQTTYPALVFIGAAVTFGEQTKQCEVYLLNYTGPSIYGDILQVKIGKKIRENQSFPTVHDLKHQIQKDEHYARSYFQL